MVVVVVVLVGWDPVYGRRSKSAQPGQEGMDDGWGAEEEETARLACLGAKSG